VDYELSGDDGHSFTPVATDDLYIGWETNARTPDMNNEGFLDTESRSKKEATSNGLKAEFDEAAYCYCGYVGRYLTNKLTVVDRRLLQPKIAVDLCQEPRIDSSLVDDNFDLGKASNSSLMRARGAFSGVVASRDLSNGNLLLWSLWLEVDSTTSAVEGNFLELATSLIMSDGDLSLGRIVLSMLNITVVGYSD